MDTPVIIGLLVIAAVWSVYLLPVVFGERRAAPMASTEEFDRWTHSMAHVQKHTADDLASSGRNVIRRRRNTLGILILLAGAPLVLAWTLASMAWLLVGLFFVSLIVLYIVLLAQMRQRRRQQQKVTHLTERTTEWDKPPVKVIAN